MIKTVGMYCVKNENNKGANVTIDVKQKSVKVNERKRLSSALRSTLKLILDQGGSKRVNAFNSNGIEHGRILVEKGYLEEKPRIEKKGTEFVLTPKGQEYLEYESRHSPMSSSQNTADLCSSGAMIVDKSKLVTNSGHDHAKIISPAIASADKILIYSAFLKTSGLSQIRHSLQSAVNTGANIKVLAGLDFFITEPAALWELYNLFEGHNNATLLLASAAKTTFHPKLYYFEKGGMVTIIIGSANLTSGGLSKNFELSILQKLPLKSSLVDELNSYVAMVEEDSRVSPATRINLSQYERRYEVFSKIRKKAEKEAEEEISQIFSYDENIFKAYRKEYLNSKKEQDGFEKRKEAYIKAKALLDDLLTMQIKNKTQFLSIYEQLVGKAGSKGLWYSGSLFRKKNDVAQNYPKFINLLKDIQKNLAEPPETLFNIGIKYAREISGLGPNVLTEIMNTYAPNKFSVLNKNPISSLTHLGFEVFKTLGKTNVTGVKYLEFNSLIQEIADLCKFKDLAQVDHFLNFVYFKYAKPQKVEKHN